MAVLGPSIEVSKLTVEMMEVFTEASETIIGITDVIVVKCDRYSTTFIP